MCALDWNENSSGLFFILNTILNIREFWYVILQPLPLFVVLVLFIASKLSVKAVVGMCIADYVFLKFIAW